MKFSFADRTSVLFPGNPWTQHYQKVSQFSTYVIQTYDRRWVHTIRFCDTIRISRSVRQVRRINSRSRVARQILHSYCKWRSFQGDVPKLYFMTWTGNSGDCSGDHNWQLSNDRCFGCCKDMIGKNEIPEKHVVNTNGRGNLHPTYFIQWIDKDENVSSSFFRRKSPRPDQRFTTVNLLSVSS
jgi:hypothetical protein